MVLLLSLEFKLLIFSCEKGFDNNLSAKDLEIIETLTECSSHI